MENLKYNDVVIGRIYKLDTGEYVFQPAMLDGYWDRGVLRHIMGELAQRQLDDLSNRHRE